jgi:hypothetical protein
VLVAESQLNKDTKEELGDFALMNADGNGGMKIKIKEIKRKQLFINTYAHTVVRSSVFMGIKIGSIAAIIAT